MLNSNNYQELMKNLKYKLSNKINKVRDKVTQLIDNNSTIFAVTIILFLIGGIETSSIVNSPEVIFNYKDFLESTVLESLGMSTLGITPIIMFSKINEKFLKSAMAIIGSSMSAMVVGMMMTNSLTPNIQDLSQNSSLAKKFVIAEKYKSENNKLTHINNFINKNFNYNLMFSNSQKNENSKNTFGLEELYQTINNNVLNSKEKNITYEDILDNFLKNIQDVKDGNGKSLKSSIKEQLILINIYKGFESKLSTMSKEDLKKYTPEQFIKELTNKINKYNLHNFNEKKIIDLIKIYEINTNNHMSVDKVFKKLNELSNNIRVQEIVNQNQELGN